jgi:tetratricopeptide (TPR) repeat protein
MIKRNNRLFFREENMKKLVLILMAFLIISKSAANEREIKHNVPNFDSRAIVILGYLDWRQNATGTIKWPRVAFAIGDGTLLMTAAHCVQDFNVPPDKAVSMDTVVISPYYGDVFDFKIAAIDKQADIAILKAPWPGHPAIKLASDEEFAAAKTILIVSRPQENADNSFRVGREIKTELLEILNKNDSNPFYDLRLKGTKYVVPGWSGSPTLIPDSGTVAGILTRGIDGIKGKLFGLITVTSRDDAAGCNLQSIKALIDKYNLEKPAFASPVNYEVIPDAEKSFNLAIDFFDALLTKKESNSFQIATEFTKVRPNSVQAHLLLALSSTIEAKDPNVSESEYLNLADSSYKKALQLDPNNAHAHAVYSNFLIRTGKNKEALEQCNASLASDPNNRMALFNKLVVVDTNERKEIAEHLLTIEPNNPTVWYYYSEALSSLNKNDKALQAAQKAVDIDPNGLFYGGLADVLVKVHRYDEAEPNYKIMTEKCGCQSCWFKYANFLVHYRKDKFEEAKKALEKAESLLRTRRISELNINLLKLSLLEKTEPNKAETVANELLKASPYNCHYWYMFAGILRTLKKYPEAVEAAQKAVDLCPDQSYRPRLANCLAKVGELQKAEQIYHDLHKEFPDRFVYWFWYAEFLVDNFDDRIDEAKEVLEKVPYNEFDNWSVPVEDLRKLQEKISEKSKQLSLTPN